MEAQKARKEYRKMMSKVKLKKSLEDLEDYESYYNNDNQEDKKEDSGSESDGMSHHFKNERERHFYKHGKDVDFMRYHKRVTRNFHECIQEMLESEKMIITSGIYQGARITVNYVRVNKACSVVYAWWTVQELPAEFVPDHLREM